MTARLEAAIHELAEALLEAARTEAAADPRTPDRLLSVREAGEVLGVGRTMTFDLVARGKLRSIRLGRRRLVPESAIREYVADYIGRM